jgi:hypothetical protein
LKSFAERQAERAQADKAKAQVAQAVAERSAVVKTEDQKLHDALDERVSAIRSDIRYAAPHEKPALLEKLKLFETKLADQKAKMAEADRAEKFGKSDLTRLAREYVDVVERQGDTLYGAVDPHERAILIQIARSTDWESPEAMYQEFVKQRDYVEDTQLNHDRREASIKQEAALKAGMEAAQADVRVAEGELRRAQGGNDAGSS